jgi:hypothetical protein
MAVMYLITAVADGYRDGKPAERGGSGIASSFAMNGGRRANHQLPSRATADHPHRAPLLVVDEVGYIPFDPQAANLMFMLVSRRYERASMIVTSNKPFSAWGEIFGDDIVAAAMIDRLVHPGIPSQIKKGVHFQPAQRGASSTGLDTSPRLRHRGPRSSRPATDSGRSDPNTR